MLQTVFLSRAKVTVIGETYLIGVRAVTFDSCELAEAFAEKMRGQGHECEPWRGEKVWYVRLTVHRSPAARTFAAAHSQGGYDELQFLRVDQGEGA